MADHTHSGQEQFAQWVRDAFTHLYDSLALQKNPLASMLSKEEDLVQRGINLRKTLLQAIRLAQPPPSTPADSADWRCYRILKLRYIEGMTPQQVMQELAIGRSQFYQEQARALEKMTAILLHKLRPYAALAEESSKQSSEPALLQQELLRLHGQLEWGQVDVTRLIEELQPTLSNLLAQRGSLLRVDLTRSFTIPWGNRMLLRQAVLSLVTAFVDIGAMHCLELGVLEDRIYVQGSWDTVNRPDAPVTALESRLTVVRQLVTDLGGELEISSFPNEVWKAELCWPKKEFKSLMVIDDNEDLAVLFRRYLATKPWRVVGVTNGLEARAQLAKEIPAIIVMDVLMPREDGWELLAAFRNDPTTRDIPIIVCSVLHQPELALSLGADAYLNKPVTREALLAVLKQWA